MCGKKKMSKVKGLNPKSGKRKQLVTCKGAPKRLSTDFSSETLHTRMQWHDIFKMLKEKKSPTNNTVPSKVIIQK